MALNDGNMLGVNKAPIQDTMGNNEGDVNATLRQRGSIYGNYKDVVKTRVNIMRLLNEHHHNVNGHYMDEETKMILSDIVLKLVRGAGAPDYADSFHDLAGYSKLMEDIINENSH